ncbi:hypothetical protein B296_00015649 [Ensete ventricosum]|uniref:Uncharacterized protein n=1 Tax=Ensete ventricosum TaxID=4639 RepID=A0A426YVJ7_ENSVE|nr:hypothetical protein B296_00015649 [Ensete ventricosum]
MSSTSWISATRATSWYDDCRIRFLVATNIRTLRKKRRGNTKLRRQRSGVGGNAVNQNDEVAGVAVGATVRIQRRRHSRGRTCCPPRLGASGSNVVVAAPSSATQPPLPSLLSHLSPQLLPCFLLPLLVVAAFLLNCSLTCHVVASLSPVVAVTAANRLCPPLIDVDNLIAIKSYYIYDICP